MIQHELFSEVSGDGPVDVEVRLLPPNRLADWSGRHPVLALVHGGRFGPLGRPDPLAVWRIACSTDATDFEHDRCDFIRLDVAAPTAVLGAHGGEMVYLGTLASALMWPTGTDPLQQSEPDTQAGACDGWPGMAGEHDPHPMAAYVPSRRDEVDAIVPSFVAVTVWPTADGRAHDSEGGSH